MTLLSVTNYLSSTFDLFLIKIHIFVKVGHKQKRKAKISKIIYSDIVILLRKN